MAPKVNVELIVVDVLYTQKYNINWFM